MGKDLVKRRSSKGIGKQSGASRHMADKYLAKVRESAIVRFQKAPLSMSAEDAVVAADWLVRKATPHAIAVH